MFESLEQPPNIVFQADNLETAKKLVIRKAGICFLPELCARQEMQEGTLVPVDIIETAGISLQTNLISLTGENSLFVESLLERVAELSY